MAQRKQTNLPSPPLETSSNNDGRPQPGSASRAQTTTGGATGARGNRSGRGPFGLGRSRQSPTNSNAVRTKPAPTPAPVPPPPKPPAPAQIDPPRKPQPKVPQPPIPDITNLVGNKGLTQRPERYIIRDRDFTITAAADGVGQSPNIKPITLERGARPELKPLLRANGIVVKVGDDYLVSPQTLADITKSGNPHYDIIENGRIGNTAMGKTVPIIELNISNLVATGSRRDIINSFAGVKSVDYLFETPTVMGISEGYIDQINYTLDPNTQRPEDRFEVWGLNLTGDYSIEKLKTDTAQEGGKLDKKKLETFTKGVADRLTLLQRDLNIIKGLFYRGELAEDDRKNFYTVNRRATVEADTEDEIRRPETSNYVIRDTKLIKHVETAITIPTEETAPAATPTAAAPAALPETITSPTDGIIPKEISKAGLEKSKLLDDWNSYGFTPQEKAELKKTVTGRKPFVKVADGTDVGIGGVRWSPNIANKARVILPYTEGPDTLGRRGFPEQREWRERWDAYYGFGNGKAKELNMRRIAELMHLTAKVVELEKSQSKKY